MASLFRILRALLLLLSSPLPAAIAEEELPCRIFPVPPDFASRGQTPPAEEAAPVDPFAGLIDTPRAKLQPYPFAIAGLGETAPLDVRPVLESLGVSFDGRAIALLGTTAEAGTLLFVRNTEEQLALIETLNSGFGGDEGWIRHVLVTFRWDERLTSGRTRLLLQRTLLCRTGQRASFQRHRGNTLVEEIETEAVVGEDGITVDLNLACDLTSGNLRLGTQTMALVCAGAPASVRLATARGASPGTHTELTVRAELLAHEMPYPPFTALGKIIADQIEGIESGSADKQNAAEIYWFPLLNHIQAGAARRSTPGLSSLRSSEWHEARAALGQLDIALEDGEQAWFAPQSRLLYLHAGLRTRTKAAGIAWNGVLQPPLQFEAAFEATRSRRGRLQPLSTRTLLIRSGHRAGSKFPIQGAPDEQVELEAQTGTAGEMTDCNLSLDHYPVGRDTWSFKGQCYAHLDGKTSVPLVSGRAADAGRTAHAISFRARRADNPWLAFVHDPARKAEAIRQIEAAISPLSESARPELPRPSR